MKLALQPRPDQAALILAMARGYFDKQGIDIETVSVGSSSELMPFLAQNQIQVGDGSVAPALFNALNRGVQVKLVADYARLSSPDDISIAMVGRKDLVDSSAIKTVADFAGRTISLGPVNGGFSQYALDQGLAKLKANSSTIKYATMNYPEIVTALGNKGLDGGMLVEPLVTQAVLSGVAKVVAPGGSLVPGAQNALLYYSPRFAQNPAAATGFMVAFLQGERDYYDAFHLKKNRDAAIAVLTQKSTLKDPKVWDNIDSQYGDIDGKMDLQDLQTQAEAYQKQGQLQGAIPDIRSFVDTRFIDAAVQQLGSR